MTLSVVGDTSTWLQPKGSAPKTPSLKAFLALNDAQFAGRKALITCPNAPKKGQLGQLSHTTVIVLDVTNCWKSPSSRE
jgi:hypothetical protein